MGTANFHNVNAQKIYAISDDGIVDSSDVECLHDNIRDLLKDEVDHDDYYDGDSMHDPDEISRAHPSTCLCQLSKRVKYGNLDLAVTIVCIIRSGYYSGANLDWHYSIDFNGDVIWDISTQQFNNYHNQCYSIKDELEEELTDEWESSGLAKCHIDKVVEKVSIASQKLIKDVESVYNELTTPLTKVAQFSNGEAIYEKC